MIKILPFILLFSTFSMFSQGGSLDTSFGTGGKVVTSINSGEDKARGVALQDDGKIVVAGYTYNAVFGYDFACVRYNVDGSLDSTFGTNGKVSYDLQAGSDDKAYSIDIQLDGKIVIVGYSDDGSDRAGAVIRLNSNGTLDNTFNSSGKVFTNFTIYFGFSESQMHFFQKRGMLPLFDKHPAARSDLALIFHVATPLPSRHRTRL